MKKFPRVSPATRRAGIRLMLAAGLALAAASGYSMETTETTETTETGEQPVVRLDTTLGVIDIELYPEKAPQTVENFLSLVDDGFYDGLIFHRVAANFVIQTGGYDHKLTYRSPPRQIPNESHNGLSNKPFSVAMARLDDPDSADTQFFINVRENTQLDAQPGAPGYTVFGQVVNGQETVTRIELMDTHIEAGMASVPEEDVIIRSATRR